MLNMDESQYVKLLRDEEDNLPEKAFTGSISRSPEQNYSKSLILQLLLHVILLSTSALLLLYMWRIKVGIPASVLRHTYARHKQWKNVMGDVPDLYHQTRFDGEFSQSDIYKGPPNVDVDAAWKRLIPLDALRVDEETFAAVNASRYSIRLPEDLDGGYLAFFESVHYMHCIFALWQSTYPDYYKAEWQYGIDHPQAWHAHLDHCADILRQKIMCDADVGLLGFNWIKNHYFPHPNFNTQHQCRDYEVVLNFARTHEADPEGKHDPQVLRPEGQPTVNYEKPPYDPFLKGDADF